MAEYKFRPLTVDNAFDFADILAVIGVEEALKAFDLAEIKSMKKDQKQLGVYVAMKIVGILVNNLSGARNEIYRFFAGCLEWDNGSAFKVDDLKNMRLKQFANLIKEFAKQDDLTDFFGDVAELLGTESNDSEKSSSKDTATLKAI